MFRRPAFPCSFRQHHTRFLNMPTKVDPSETSSDDLQELMTEAEAFLLKQERIRRQTIIDAALKMPLLDAVFSVMLYHQRYWAFIPKRRLERIDVNELFPSASSEELGDARTRAAGLLGSAYDAGDSHLSSKFTNRAQLLEQLAASHPGFAVFSYDATIEYGCYLAR